MKNHELNVTTDIETAYTRWYAVMETEEDDWGWGSYLYSVAIEMLKEQGSGLIAVIEFDDMGTGQCVDERRYEDFDWED